MVQTYPLTKELIQNLPIKNLEISSRSLTSANDTVLYIEDFIQYTLVAINSFNANKIAECWHIAEQLFHLNDERVTGILSMHFMVTIFPTLEKKIPSREEIKGLLSEKLLFHFNYYLMLENNWLY